MNELLTKLKDIKDYMVDNDGVISVTISSSGISLLVNEDLFNIFKQGKTVTITDNPSLDSIKRSIDIKDGMIITFNRRDEYDI